VNSRRYAQYKGMRSFPRAAAAADRAEGVARRAFDAELREGLIRSLEVDRGCSIFPCR